jgi:hypothetical protein
MYNDGDGFNGLLSQWRSVCEETKCKGGGRHMTASGLPVAVFTAFGIASQAILVCLNRIHHNETNRDGGMLLFAVDGKTDEVALMD